MSEIKIKILVAIGVLFFILYGYNINLQKELKQTKDSFEEYKKQASKLIALQDKWSNHEEDKKLLESVEKRFKPARHEVSKNIHILEFNNLSKSTLNRLTRVLLNSDLTFKNLHLKRGGEKISLHVEVEI